MGFVEMFIWIVFTLSSVVGFIWFYVDDKLGKEDPLICLAWYLIASFVPFLNVITTLVILSILLKDKHGSTISN